MSFVARARSGQTISTRTQKIHQQTTKTKQRDQRTHRRSRRQSACATSYGRRRTDTCVGGQPERCCQQRTEKIWQSVNTSSPFAFGELSWRSDLCRRGRWCNVEGCTDDIRLRRVAGGGSLREGLFDQSSCQWCWKVLLKMSRPRHEHPQVIDRVYVAVLALVQRIIKSSTLQSSLCHEPFTQLQRARHRRKGVATFYEPVSATLLSISID